MVIIQTVVASLINVIFKSGAPANGQHVPGFLELLCPRMLVCVFVCVCVSAPRLLISSGVMYGGNHPQLNGSVYFTDWMMTCGLD